MHKANRSLPKISVDNYTSHAILPPPFGSFAIWMEVTSAATEALCQGTLLFSRLVCFANFAFYQDIQKHSFCQTTTNSSIAIQLALIAHEDFKHYIIRSDFAPDKLSIYDWLCRGNQTRSDFHKKGSGDFFRLDWRRGTTQNPLAARNSCLRDRLKARHL
jgi:hypothetical protein